MFDQEFNLFVNFILENGHLQGVVQDMNIYDRGQQMLVNLCLLYFSSKNHAFQCKSNVGEIPSYPIQIVCMVLSTFAYTLNICYLPIVYVSERGIQRRHFLFHFLLNIHIQ